MLQKVKKFERWAPLFIRLGLAFIFLWSALSKLLADTEALGVCTNVDEAISLVGSFAWFPISPELFVLIQSWAELVLGLLLLFGLWIELAAAGTALVFLLFFVFLDFDLIWKNVALLGASLALLVLPADPARLDNKTRSWWQFWRR
ncbi:MAG: DoxX family membrane protein [Patescibacteria group bacterium]